MAQTIDEVGLMNTTERAHASSWPWVLVAQLNSLFLLAMSHVMGSPFALSERQVLALGETFSMILIALGIWGYAMARKRPVPPAVWIAMGLVAPAYAVCGGKMRTIISYFIVTLGLHLIFLWRQHLYLDTDAPSQGPSDP